MLLDFLYLSLKLDLVAIIRIELGVVFLVSKGRICVDLVVISAG